MRILRLCSKFSENFDFGQNFRKISILVKILRKIVIFVKIPKISNLGQNFGTISILVKVFENLDFGESFRKSRF